MTAPAGTHPLIWLTAVVLVAAIPAFFSWRSSRRILNQVQNDHTENLREDLDRKFAAVHSQIHTMDQGMRSLREDVHLVRDEARDDRSSARETRRRIEAVDNKLTTHLRDTA